MSDIYKTAIQEAYASAPTNEVILHTLELRSSSFENTAIRVVADFGETFEIEGNEINGHYLTLESDAPINARTSVLFQSCMFEFSLPEQKEGSIPSIEISLDNVALEISNYLDALVGTKEPIEVTYREYLLSDPDTPQFILSGLTMNGVTSNLSKVRGTAKFQDLLNKSFPGKVYRPNEYRGLL